MCSKADFEMWGDGEQTRSFCYIDDCVEGVLRLFHSDVKEPINIGSEEMVSMNNMAAMALELAGKKIPIRHIPGPEGVRGRNSNNDLIRKVLNWAPAISLKDGLSRTYGWIKAQVDAEKEKGVDVAQYATSSVVVNEKLKDIKHAK
jgi:GDP-D-mannose 3',5'-epimerase